MVEKVMHMIKNFVVRLLIFVVLYFFALAANVLSLAIRSLIGYTAPGIDGYFFIQSLHFYIPLFMVYVVYWAVKNRLAWQNEREQKLKAEGLVQEARWMMLRYQVNPHFLFNALNSIRALIGLNDEKARKIVTEMSEYFRYSLSIEQKPLVPFKEEIRAVDNYLEIQTIRYPERLSVSKNLDVKTLDCLVPVFTVQTLIENSIKYGLKTHEGIVEIGIHSKTEQGKLHVLISNTGRLVDPDAKEKFSDSTQTGLENLKYRLGFLDKHFSFSLYEEGDKVIASVILTQCKHNENLESNHSG
jgi:LytS/YehU family sensor histidine kinase